MADPTNPTMQATFSSQNYGEEFTNAIVLPKPKYGEVNHTREISETEE